MAHKLKHGNRAKDWWVPNKTLKICDVACGLKRKNSSYNQMIIIIMIEMLVKHEPLI